ncbi:IclR family transcriptional regulator [Pseudoroseicyclus tamaricis]|uniref:IclR family transcriptional regulator n=1 Tax=Pseudoroseicyclus tamaricis TaxID=2705421 RepID=A0A6B2JIL4_9RHOB|nr:IclR family transcriptional regulator [Pseudoroseicyclus tamaricis]NDV01221.1 IclR family transcriptional regulator [Pseudoroseicyclus tamaricis]
MYVKQAANVVELLEFFATHGEAATIAEIADTLGWPRSSTFNIIGTLVEKGYLYEPRSRGGYFPSPRWQTIIRQIEERDPVPTALIDLIDTIAERTGETTALASASGLHVIMLYVRESRQPIRYFASIGTRVPIHASSVGRAILVQMSEKEREALYRKLVFEKYSTTTPMSIERIEAELRAAGERGYHQSQSEYIADLAGASVPLPFGGKRLSIVSAGPVSRCLERRGDMAAIMREAISEAGLRDDPGALLPAAG